MLRQSCSRGRAVKYRFMNKEELLQALRKESVREDAFDLNGGHLPETYTLSESYGRWFVYYSEKGLESGKEEFATQSQACEYLLNLLKKRSHDANVTMLCPTHQVTGTNPCLQGQ